MESVEVSLPKTFCVFPWSGLYISPLGDFYPCCLNENESSELNSMKDSLGRSLNANNLNVLERNWNSKSMKKMRRQMLNGEWPEACKSCQIQEESGFISYRMSEIQNYIDIIPDLISRTEPDGTSAFHLLQMDIKPGNICNLKCAMCSPLNSRLTISSEKNFFLIERKHIIKNI